MRIWILMLMMLGATLTLGQTPPVPPAPPVDNVQKCKSILDIAIHDHNPDVRKGAAEAISLLGIKDNPRELLTSMLDDHDVSVRIAVVVSLGLPG